MYEWAIKPTNKDQCNSLALKLGTLLEPVIKSLTTKARREKMWSDFSKCLQTPEYKAIWSGIYRSIPKVQASYIAHFFIIHQYLIRSLKYRFPVEKNSAAMGQHENALRYVGGYMIRSLTKKIQKLKTDHVDEMLVSILVFGR